jgi:integrase
MLGLGAYPEITIAEARKLASAKRALMVAKVDPLTERREKHAALVAANERAKNTFGTAFVAWYKKESQTWRNDEYRGQVRRSVENYCKPIWHRPVNEIDDAAVRSIVGPVVTERVVSGKRLIDNMRQVLDFATAHKWRDPGPNPAQWKGYLNQIYNGHHKVEHHGFIALQDCARFASDLRKVEGATARCLELLLLTATRTGDARFAKWSQMSEDLSTWTIPKTKNGKPLTVPLCGRVVEILRDMPRVGEFIFSGIKKNKPFGHNEMRKVMDALKPVAGDGNKPVPHGLRRSFKTWASERTRFAPDVIEAALGHNVGNKVERGYNAGELIEKRRALMDSWAQLLTRPTIEGGKVLHLHRA